jgi:hypothetical protein
MRAAWWPSSTPGLANAGESERMKAFGATSWSRLEAKFGRGEIDA